MFKKILSIFSDPNKIKHDVFLSDAQVLRSVNVVRQVALEGVYLVTNTKNITTLSGEDSLEYTAEIKDMMGRLWGISGPDHHQQSLGLFHWMITEGHRIDPSQFPNCSPQDLLAWDVCRLVSNIRCCFYLNYISADEAFGLLQVADDITRNNFASWKEYGYGFLRAKISWDDDIDANFFNENQGIISSQSRIGDAVKYLVEDPASVWNQVPWST